MSKIIVAPFSMHKGLMAFYRKQDVFNDVKFITKEELLKDSFGEINRECIAYLMKITNRNAAACYELCRYIPYINKDSENPKLHNLYTYNQEFLEKEFLKTNEYLKQYFNQNEVVVYGYSKEDLELNNIFNYLDINASYANEGNKPNFKNKTITCFNKTSLEIANMLNEISSLLDEGISINDIYIYANDEIVLFYLKEFSKDCGFKINFTSEEKISNTEISKLFIKEYEKNKNLEESLLWLNEQNDELKENILSAIKECTFNFLSDEQQFDLIQESLKKWSIKSTHFDNAVTVIKDVIYTENAYVFVPCFAEGIVPFSSKDNGYLNDSEKEIYKINPSYLNNKFEMRKIVDFLSSNNTFYLSFSYENISNKMNVSPISLLFDIPLEKFKMPTKFYSKRFASILASIAKDQYELYGKDSAIRHSLTDFYKNVDDFDNNCGELDIFDKNVTLTHSYTSISTYYNCPFQYYLTYVLGVKEIKDSFNLRFGNLTHNLFYDCYKKGTDFEVAFASAKKKLSFDIAEEYLINLAKPQLKLALDSFKKHENEYMDPHKFLLEEQIDIEVKPQLLFTGKIDKLNILDDEYAVIIDYKSGKESFDFKRLKYGLNMQLPIYALLVKKSINYKDYKIGGIYISNFFNSSYVDEEKVSYIIPEYLKLNGLTHCDNNFDFLKKFDYTYENVDGSSFIKGIVMKKGAIKSKNIFSEEEMEEYIKIVEGKIIDADEEIKRNNFCINPYFLGDKDNACRYCPYRDICFVKWGQFNDLNETEVEEDG